ncbi:RnfH family protein [Paraglaciecola sp.]|uniref:RnfH family protein n=1 Tax=Paraglaciecola sp. TaxID=1920173 RepID=UPI003EFB05F7
MNQENLAIEVVYGTPEKQVLLELNIELGVSVEQAILSSGITQHFPEIDLQTSKVGIWNRACKLSDIPKDGDRIEIYRPLIADPKEVRRKRAEKAKEEGRANKVTGGRTKQK